MSELDNTIKAFRERLENLDAQQNNEIKKIGLFSGAARPDALRLLQGDITRLLTQVKLQPEVLDATSQQLPDLLRDLTELRAKVRAMMHEGSNANTVKKNWTEVRKQAESSPAPVSPHSVFKQWAENKRAVDEDNNQKPEGPASTNK